MIHLPRACRGKTAVWFPANSSNMCCMELARNRAFSHEFTATILVFQNNETAAMLVYPENPLGVELFCHVNAFFWSNKLAWMLATWVITLYRLLCTHLDSKGFWDAGLPRSLTQPFCHAGGPCYGRSSCLWLPLPAWYGCAHAWGTGPAMGWCMCAPCFTFALFQCNRIKLTLFFISYYISWHF